MTYVLNGKSPAGWRIDKFSDATALGLDFLASYVAFVRERPVAEQIVKLLNEAKSTAPQPTPEARVDLEGLLREAAAFAHKVAAAATDTAAKMAMSDGYDLYLRITAALARRSAPTRQQQEAGAARHEAAAAAIRALPLPESALLTQPAAPKKDGLPDCSIECAATHVGGEHPDEPTPDAEGRRADDLARTNTRLNEEES